MPSFKPADVDSAQPFARDETKSGDQSDPLVNGMAISQIKSMNIKTVQIEKTRTITPYDSQVLRESVQSASYSAWKRTFVNPHHQKNSRFQLNELAKANMSVEQEEELRIETEVQKRVFERLKELTDRTLAKAQGDGFAKGLEEGMKEAQIRSQPTIDAVMKLLEDLNQVATTLAAENEEFIIKIVYQIARKILLREVVEDPDFVRRAVTGILNRLGTKDNVKIYIAPREMAALEKLKADLQTSLGEMRNLSIEPDPRITNGGCRVETDFGNVDATIEAQLDSIGKALNSP